MIPTGIVFVNNDLTESTKSALVKQLYITDIYDGYGYDTLIASDPNFITFVHNNNRRVMVIRSFREEQNRETADVVIFVTHGTATILKNKFGPPQTTYRVAELTWQKLCVFDLPIYKCCNCNNKCDCNCGCHRRHSSHDHNHSHGCGCDDCSRNRSHRSRRRGCGC